jgi:thioredoxin-like negative regulator of GroEL
MEIPTTGSYVLKFTASWCGPCRQIHPLLSRCEEEYDIPVKVVDIDEEGALAEEYGVASIPHMVFVHDGKTEVVVQGANGEKILEAFQILKKKRNQIVLPHSKEAEVKNGRLRDPESFD